MNKALIDLGLIAAQIIAYMLCMQFVRYIMFGDFSSLLGLVITTMVFLPLIVWITKDFRPPWQRTWARLTGLFTFDIEIDTARKSDSKDQLKRNPLDDD